MATIDEIQQDLTARAEGKKPFGKTITFDLGDEGVITVDGTGEAIAVSQTPSTGDVTIKLSGNDLKGLISGELNPQALMMTGRVKLAGNTMVAMKLGEILR